MGKWRGSGVNLAEYGERYRLTIKQRSHPTHLQEGHRYAHYDRYAEEMLRRPDRGVFGGPGLPEGITPPPHDGDPHSWSEFLKRHAKVIWQCDFAGKKKWTVKGLVDVYFLVFIHLGTCRIWVSPSTDHPTGDWTTQQARNFQMHIE